MKPIINHMIIDDELLNNKNYTGMEAYGDHIARLDNSEKEQLPEVRLLSYYTGLLNIAALRTGGISGRVLELGSGMGCFASILSRNLKIEELKVIEYSRSLLDKAFPAMFKFLKMKHNDMNVTLISRIHGSYNDITLEDCTMDFVIANHSLHHSYNVRKTISEAFRVLKPGGYMIVLERVLGNDMSDEEIILKGETELGVRHKTRYGVPLEKDLTSRDMGEHYWREKEWIEFLVSKGFCLVNIIKTRKFRNRYIHALYRRWSKFVYNDYILKSLLIMQKRITLYRYFTNVKKGITVFVLRKPL